MRLGDIERLRSQASMSIVKMVESVGLDRLASSRVQICNSIVDQSRRLDLSAGRIVIAMVLARRRRRRLKARKEQS